MNRRTYVTMVAGVASLLSTTALTGVFDGFAWLPVIGGSVVVVVLTGLTARAFGTPAWLQPVVELLVLGLYATIVFGHDRFLGIVPTPATIAGLHSDIGVAFADIAELAAPVPARPGILLLTVGGVGLVAVLVDLLAVVLGRAALAGLPLLGLYTVPVAVDRNGIGWFPFALGAAGFCWLLAAEHGDRIHGWGRAFQPANTRGGSADADLPGRAEPPTARAVPARLMAGRLGVFGIAVAVLIPAAVPALSADGLHSLFDGGFPGSSGGRTITAINPVTELRGQLTEKDPVELLRVRTDDNEPFYLRLATLERFTGTGWTLRDLRAEPQARVSRGVPDVSGLDADTPTRSQSTTIQIRGLTQSPYLPLYSDPTSINVDGDWRFDRNSEAVFSTGDNKTKGLTYQFNSKRVLYTSSMLADAPELPANNPVARYTVLDNPEPSVKKQVNELIAGKTSEYQKVLAINNFFSPENGFTYSLKTAAGTSESAIVSFLQNRQGYCEQYASAMAYMVRVAGLPARVAIGFGYGTHKGNYWSVTSYDAHAWVEVYFSGLGWVPFDPTPSTGTGRSGELAWVDTQVDQTGSNSDNSTSDQPSSAAPSAAAAAPSPSASSAAPDAEGSKSGGKGRSIFATIATVLVWLLGILAVLGLAAAPSLLRRRLRRRRLTAVAEGTDPASAAHAAWDEVVDTLIDLDSGADEADTPRGLSRRLGEDGLDGPAKGALTLLAAAEEQARYSPRVTMVPGLADAVVTVRAALHQRSTRRRRILAEIVPASTLERAGSAVRTGVRRRDHQ
jgi:transglutaminase-like putative cysteine protease